MCDALQTLRSSLLCIPTTRVPAACPHYRPLAGALFAQVAHERQQQLSQAQYELSLAREQLAVLAVEQRSVQQEAAAAPPTARANGSHPSCNDAQLSPAEMHALHGAVLVHLQAHGFKVAAVSLSKEARLAGGAAATPAPAASLAAMFAAAQQLEAQSTRLHELEVQAERQGRELAAARQELEESRGREAVAAAEAEFLGGKLAALEQAEEQAQEQQQHKQQQQQQRDDQQQGQQGQQEQRPQASQRLGAAGALVEVAACMPQVLPNLLINKRDGERQGGRAGRECTHWRWQRGAAQGQQERCLWPRFVLPLACNSLPCFSLSNHASPGQQAAERGILAECYHHCNALQSWCQRSVRCARSTRKQPAGASWQACFLAL